MLLAIYLAINYKNEKVRELSQMFHANQKSDLHLFTKKVYLVCQRIYRRGKYLN